MKKLIRITPLQLLLPLLLLVCQLFGQQNIQSQIHAVTNQTRSTQKLGKTILDLTSLKKFYELRDYNAVWFSEGKFNNTGEKFVAVLKNPEEFGFERSDYWDLEIENTFKKSMAGDLDESSLLWQELFYSDLAIKFAKHLYQGRLLDPDLVDDETKYKRKVFSNYNILNQILSGNPEEMGTQLSQLEPKNWVYKKLKLILKTFLDMEASNKWQSVEVAVEGRVRGSKSPQILALKQQMSLYGFKFQSLDQNGSLTDIYDEELETALSQYHQLYKTGGSGITDGVLRSMNNSLESRKSQLRVALEKARWLPDELESNHIFVNLAFQEFKLFENHQLLMEMKTINGQKFRRTPLMRDLVTTVELTPTWTVPFSIAVKDKLSKIKKNPGYLSDHNMKLIDNFTGEEVDPYTVDWENITKSEFKYTIVQGSGPDNALGLVKFPLTNPWAIYMHDTNERNLFTKPQRLLSSGCIRLEKPFEFANYLLRDNSNYTPEVIQKIINESLKNPKDMTPTRIKVKKTVPVYILFLTVDISSGGIIRFADDIYGSDARLKGVLHAQNKFSAKHLVEFKEGMSLSENQGSLIFKGQVGEQQIAKNIQLYKCKSSMKASCELQGQMELNKTYPVLVGEYLAIYENSMSPEFIKIEAKKNTEVELLSVVAPEIFKSEVNLKLYKDVTQTEEQNKIYKEAFYFKSSPFMYSQYENEFYYSSYRMKTLNQRLDYSYCQVAANALSDEAGALCRVYRSAKTEGDMEDLFSFSNLSSSDRLTDGQYFQLWITKPGDRFKMLHKKILLSAPFSGNERVLVFPGSYKLLSERANQVVSVRAH